MMMITIILYASSTAAAAAAAVYRMGTRGVSFTMLAHWPSHKSSKVMSSTGLPPKSRGPRHVGFESHTFCLFARSHLQTETDQQTNKTRISNIEEFRHRKRYLLSL